MVDLAGLATAGNSAISGYNAGMDLQEKRRQLAARAALAKTMSAPGQGQPMAAPQMGPPGAQPMPPGVASQPSGPPGGGLAQPMPPQGGMPQQSPPPGSPQGGGMPPQPQQQQPSGFVNDTKTALQGMYAQVAKANPKLTKDPITMSYAVDQMLQQMKGIEPDTKLYLQAQIAEQRINSAAQIQAMKADSAADVAKIKADAAKEVADMRADAMKAIQDAKDEAAGDRNTQTVAGREKVADIGAGARLGAAALGAKARTDSATIGAGSREKVADIGAKARGDASATEAGAKRDVADTNRKARENATAIANGKPAPYPDLGKGGEGGGGAGKPAGAPGDAKKAPDGHWYSKGKDGKYLRWD